MSVASANFTVAKEQVGATTLYLDKFQGGNYSLVTEVGGEIVAEKELGKLSKDAALAAHKRECVKATLKMMIPMLAVILEKQQKQQSADLPADLDESAKSAEMPVAAERQPVAITTDKKRVGFPKTEQVNGKTVPVVGENGKPEWIFTQKQRGIITAEAGDYRLVFSCMWHPYHFQDDNWDECVGRRLEWNCTRFQRQIPVKQEYRNGEFFDVQLDPIWVKGEVVKTNTVKMVEELARMTGRTEDQCLALINEATLDA